MTSKLFYSMEGSTQHGPISERQLKQLAAMGKLLPFHRVCKDGMEKTVKARRVKGLFVPPVL